MQIYQLFWCSPGYQGLDTYPYMFNNGHLSYMAMFDMIYGGLIEPYLEDDLLSPSAD